ncbi:hypothetical protein Tco_0106887 [Tanacetum coccineum]
MNIDSNSNPEGIAVIWDVKLVRELILIRNVLSNRKEKVRRKLNMESSVDPFQTTTEMMVDLRGVSGYDQPSLEILPKHETNHEAHDKIIQGLETKVRTLTNEVEGQINGGKWEECKAIFTEDGLPLYTPFYYSPEEIECFSANSGFSNNERQETNKSGME